MIKFDKNQSINSNFINTFESGFIALHPFYRKIFDDDFDYRKRIKDSFNLIEVIEWSEVITGLKFKDISQLANALLEINVNDSKELEEYVEYKRLVFPVINDDTIPEVLLYKYLKYLIMNNITEIVIGFTQHTLFEEDKCNINLQVREDNIFELLPKLHRRFLIFSNNINFAMLLPDYDCPYTLLLGDKHHITSFVVDSSIEGFWVDGNTKFDWWK